ncbi:BMP family ABC transporter substrate-binding protein [Actinoplanes sp. OR16]|uniref:BMP family ABC transporter substrate-binding protein n=1 Tax=Actinoplanes sp. OR16 TaxID=946334 RepID=UPI000F701B79|nr:BMP family ABC transporter substrate-binding protein [Actinoplanes sp. OR16]BBH63471.1 BMP family ABC transporter substrate-binding protein [Actinoplanes sp. OR16]
MARTALVGALAAALILTGCSTQADAEKPETDTMKVGVLFPGSLSDDGFMESAYLGYQRAEKTYAGTVAFSKVEQVATADFEAALVRFAGTSDLVIALGGQTDAAVRLVAPKFPGVKFVEIGGPADGKPAGNLALYDPQQAQAAFLAGAASGLLTKTGKVGFLGGAELPAIVNAAKEYANGVTASGAKAEVLAPQYVGDFNDVAKAKQSALADYSAGADVIGQVLNLGKKGVAQAAAQEKTALIGGPIPHDCAADPAYAGFVKTDVGAEIEYAVEHLTAGTWKAEAVKFGLTAEKPQNDIILCAADPAVQAKLDAIKADIASGKITTL